MTRENVLEALNEVLSGPIVRAVCHPRGIDTMSTDERIDALCAEIAFYDSVLGDQVDPWITFSATETRDEMASILSTAQCCIAFLNHQ